MGQRAKLVRQNAELQEEVRQLREQTQGGRLAATSSTQIRTFSGPLPAPEDLDRYNEIVPGAADRILAMAERQNEHRLALEKAAIHSEINRARAGIVCATVLSLSMLLGGVYCVLHGHDVAGGTIATGAMASVVGAFIYGTSQRRQEREKKAEKQAALAHR